MSNKFVNIETGEILSKKEISKTTKKHSIDCYVGIDTKFPSECKTTEQLIESLSVLDGFLDKGVKVNYSALLKSVNEGLLTNKESTVMAYLAENVTGWNYYIGRICDCQHIVADLKNLSRLIKGLSEKGLIRITHRDFFYKDSVVIQVSPFYVWKGDVALRQMEIQSWYSGSTNSFD